MKTIIAFLIMCSVMGQAVRGASVITSVSHSSDSSVETVSVVAYYLATHDALDGAGPQSFFWWVDGVYQNQGTTSGEKAASHQSSYSIAYDSYAHDFGVYVYGDYPNNVVDYSIATWHYYDNPNWAIYNR